MSSSSKYMKSELAPKAKPKFSLDKDYTALSPYLYTAEENGLKDGKVFI